MPADPLAPAGFLSTAFREGTSAAAALRAFKEAGGAIRTQTWYRLAGEVRAALANRGSIAALDPNIHPRDEHMTNWSAGRSGSYLYQVEVTLRDVGSGDVFRAPYSVSTNSILTPGQAIDSALDDYQDNADKYGQVILGAVAVGVYRLGAPA